MQLGNAGGILLDQLMVGLLGGMSPGGICH